MGFLVVWILRPLLSPVWRWWTGRVTKRTFFYVPPEERDVR